MISFFQKGNYHKWGICILFTLFSTLEAVSQMELLLDCTIGTADLSVITATNIPPNTSLTWHSNTPATDINKLINLTTVGTGTYYAAFFEGTTGCYSSISAAIVISDAYCSGIDAVADDFSSMPISGGDTSLTVLDNDGAVGLSPPVDLSITSPVIINDGGLVGVSFNSNGTLNIPANANAGTYILTYQICLAANSSICDQAEVLIFVSCNIPVGEIIFIRNN